MKYPRAVRTGMLIVLAAAVCLLAGWRLIPLPLETALGADTDAIRAMSCSVMEHEFSWENGQPLPIGRFYALRELKQGDVHLTAILDTMAETGYRQDFRNLLPWYDGSYHSESSAVSIAMAWVTQPGGAGTLHIVGSEAILVNGKLYHPTNTDAIKRLTNYIKTHGEVS